MSIQMRRFNIFGDTLTIKGKVVGREVREGAHLVQCEIWVENDREGISVPGKATIKLPCKG